MPGGVALALQVFRGINSALGANRVRPLDRHNGKKIHVATHLGNLDDCREPGESPAHNDYFWISHSLNQSFTTEARRHRETGAKVWLFSVSQCLRGEIVCFFHRMVKESISLPVGLYGCCFTDKKEYIVTAPTAINPIPIMRQTYPQRLCAIGPRVIPHLAAKSHSP
jgi:hypothetical protein